MSKRRPQDRVGYGEVLAKVFGRGLVPADGAPERRLSRAETRLGLALPRAMRAFYLVAGLAEETRQHNRLFAPEDLELDGRHLIFMEENQGVVHWGLRTPFGDNDDPVVWQRVAEDPSKWYSERMRFSAFIIKNLAWQRGVRLSSRC